MNSFSGPEPIKCSWYKRIKIMNTPMENVGSSLFAVETELGLLGRKITKAIDGLGNR